MRVTTDSCQIQWRKWLAFFVAGIYLTVTMAMTSLSIVLTVFVLQLHHVGPNQKPIPRWIKRLVIDVIARGLCMGNHVDNYYNSRYKAHQRQHHFNGNDVTLSQRPNDIRPTSANGRSAHKDTNASCNGGLNNYQGHLQLHPLLEKSNLKNRSRTSMGDNVTDTSVYGDNVVYDRLSSQLKILVSKNETEDDFQDIVNEWRLVAHVMDRLLFWLFLIGSLISSISILVLKPMMKPPINQL